MPREFSWDLRRSAPTGVMSPVFAGEAGALVEVAIGGDAGASSSRVPNRVT
jgi:hypothetical protein